ncbi:Beta-alanine transporter [Sergentomyia squamirostris]
MDFDSILPQVGAFGPYQKFVICGVLLPAVFPCAFHAYSQLFIAARPLHWCRVPQLDAWVRDYPEVVRNLSVPLELRDGVYKHSECLMFSRNYSEISRIWHHEGVDSIPETLQTSEVTTCKSGWNYDKKIFTTTVVTEFLIHFHREEMDFDSILPQVGDFGPYQKYVICGVLFPAFFPCAFHAYSQIFISARPDHWCRVPELHAWVTQYPEVVRNLSVPVELRDGVYKHSECLMFARNYSEIAQIWHYKGVDGIPETLQSLEVTTCKNGWNYDKKIFTNTVVTEWNLVCEKDAYATVALVLFGVGGLIGNYVFGYLQDFWGRRPSFYAYLIIEILAGCLSAIAWNYYSWVVSRILVGLTVPAILTSPYVLAIEMVGPSKRVFCTIVANIAYSLGLVLLAGIVYLFRDWRYLSIAVSLPLFILFSCFFILPESPRWLIATGKYSKAVKILQKMAQVNGKVLPCDFELTLRQKVEAAKPTTETQAYGVMDLVITPNMRKKTLIITFIWFASTSVYVGLSYYAPALGGNEIWNFFLGAVVELPTYIFLWPSLIYFGRRWILCVSMVIGGVACLATFLVQHNHVVMLILYCVAKMGISSAFVVLPLAASELYPTVVRGLGMSVSSVIGMIGPSVIPIINYTGRNMLVFPLMIMGLLLCLGGVSSLFLPETKNQPLPQTIEDGEKVALAKPFSFTKKIQVNFQETTL